MKSILQIGFLNTIINFEMVEAAIFIEFRSENIDRKALNNHIYTVELPHP